MGALAPLAKWIPEDDLLLKNAVEAGASLESLAKGAVCFSRRFTIKELQDRWRALLYDLDTSIEASARIIEIEMEVSVSNPSKATRIGCAKGKECLTGKRKGDSVRSRYYAMRKRVCNEPRSSPDLVYRTQLKTLCMGGDNARGKHLNSHTRYPNDYCVSFDKCAPEAPLLSHYGHLESNYDSEQRFASDTMRLHSSNAAGIVAAHAFSTDHREDELIDGMVKQDCSFRYANNIIPSVDKTRGNNTDQDFVHDFVDGEVPQILGENHVPLKSCSNTQEVESPQALSTNNLYEDADVEAKPMTDFDSANDNHESFCSGFVGEQNLSTQVPEYGNSVQQLGDSSTPVGLPMWTELDDVSPPTMPIDENFEVKNHRVSAPMMLRIDDVKNMDSPGCDDGTSEPKVIDGMPDDRYDHSTIISEGDLFDFSNAYMDFSDDDELLFINTDKEGTSDRLCLNNLDSLLITSPCETHQDDIPGSNDPKPAKALETCVAPPDGACPLDSEKLNDQVYSAHHDQSSLLGVNMPSTSSNTSPNAEPSEGFMICTLNTEDPEIPCNDDVVLSIQMSPHFPPSDLEHFCMQVTGSVYSPKVLLNDGKTTIEGLSMAKEEQAIAAQPFVSSLKAGSLLLPDVGLMHSSEHCRLEAELFERDSIAGAAQHAAEAIDDPKSGTSTSVAIKSAPVAAVIDENTAVALRKQGHFNSSLEMPSQGSNPAKSYSQDIANMCKLEGDLQGTPQKCGPLHAADGAFSGPITTVSNLDREELLSESEDDVPNFSDIEAMILDMDLGPYDQESCLLTREVSRCQCMDTKRAIIRLEQGAHSYMQRAMSAHGAFAIFYGRHLKYYIKSPKVLLGRGTEDINVDIDLRREGQANTVSRRQAIIKMEEDGSFFLRNIGKCSIFVNDKEVLARKRVNLNSGCLIEIRNMRFIFEINQNPVQHCIPNLQEQNTRFEWIPDRID